MPLALQLRTLQQLQQQLAAKLAGMLPEQQLQALLRAGGGGSDSPPAAGGALAVSNAAHARLAAVYVLSQQHILRAALAAVRAATEACLRTAAPVAPAAAAPQPVLQSGQPLSAAAKVAGAETAAAADGMQLHPSLLQCSQCHSLQVAAQRGSIAAGCTLLCVPLRECVVAPDQQRLVTRLMLAGAAAAGWTQAGQAQQQQQQQQQQPSGRGLEGFGRSFQREWAAGSDWRTSLLLPWWLLPRNQRLLVLLQGPLVVLVV
jgi:hypothetical protein